MWGKKKKEKNKGLDEGEVIVPDKEYCEGCLYFHEVEDDNSDVDYRCKSSGMAGIVTKIDVSKGEECPCREEDIVRKATKQEAEEDDR